ncbi:hypothetical protein [Streptomyces sp. sk226]|uniref:hypothetical protein n=1 Tax=Streptomyces sp. sk226 TaxID=2034268 RepID=UPI000BF1916A|nr:hypothetical protein [Streptomyces sp. sk226]
MASATEPHGPASYDGPFAADVRRTVRHGRSALDDFDGTEHGLGGIPAFGTAGATDETATDEKPDRVTAERTGRSPGGLPGADTAPRR